MNTTIHFGLHVVDMTLHRRTRPRKKKMALGVGATHWEGSNRRRKSKGFLRFSLAGLGRIWPELGEFGSGLEKPNRRSPAAAPGVIWLAPPVRPRRAAR